MENNLSITTRITLLSKEEADYLTDELAREWQGDFQVLSVRQLASNWWEAELYLNDVTDLYLIGCRLGTVFPKIPARR